MTQVSEAKKGNLTKEMRAVARQEGVEEEFVRKRLAEGKIVIPVNLRRRGANACGIGEGLRTKVNANIGTSQDEAILDEELQKAEAAEEAGADALMDLSTSRNLIQIRMVEKMDGR